MSDRVYDSRFFVFSPTSGCRNFFGDTHSKKLKLDCARSNEEENKLRDAYTHTLNVTRWRRDDERANKARIAYIYIKRLARRLPSGKKVAYTDICFQMCDRARSRFFFFLSFREYCSSKAPIKALTDISRV